MFLGADEFPLPWEYRKMPLDEVQNEPPADLDERTVVFLDCGNIDRMPVDFLQRDGVHIVNVDHHHDNTRFGTVNLVDSQRVVHGRDRLGARKGARRRDHAGDRRRALRRARHRHRQVHVHEHLAALAPDGGGADGGRRRHTRDLPPPVRAAAVRAAAAALARAQRGAALRRRRRDGDRPDARRLRGDGLGRDRLRGDRRPPACGGRHEGGGARARAAVRRPHRRRARSACARPTARVDVSRIARGLGGGGHRQAAGATSELPLDELLATIRKGIQEQL